jgi:hypothetical protein
VTWGTGTPIDRDELNRREVVCTGRNTGKTLQSDTLSSKGLAESVTRREKVWFRKKSMDLCVSESEEDEDGVVTGVNTTLLSDTL